MIDLKFYKLDDRAIIPKKAHVYDGGMDVWSLERENDIILKPGEKFIFKTGLACIIPEGYRLQVADRSSIGSKGVMYSAGVIDEGYANDIGIILNNVSKDLTMVFTKDPNKDYIKEIKGNVSVKSLNDPIAQLLLEEVPRVNITEATEEEYNEYKNKYERGLGGFGSTNNHK
jgi:deoxyuridine 5'-triphosphate nucleotidohydrolase